MSDVAHRLATYADVLNAPEGFTAEILAGELHLTPRPAVPHQITSSELGADVLVGFGRGGGPSGWWILDEVELHLGQPDPRSVVAVPDLAGWRRERLPERPKGPAIELAPDWVCEVLSPGARNVRRDRLLKTEAYAEAGVAWMWIVDPVAQTVEALELREGRWTVAGVFGGPVEARIPPFEAKAFDMAPWWPELGE